MSIEALPNSTIHLIKSSQVITSIRSIVKELIENAIDAGSSIINVKLNNYGFDSIEIKDNGCGISEESASLVALPHYTSKISNFTDLEALGSYGFRGEALASLCAVANVMIKSKLSSESVGHVYNFDNNGVLLSSKPTPVPNGTTIIISELFSKIPVRKQYYKNIKRRKEELSKIEDLMLSFCIILPSLHVTLIHNKTTILQKSSTRDLKESLFSSLPTFAKYLSMETAKKDEIEVLVSLPTQRNMNCDRSSTDRLFVYVNNRCVKHKSIEKLTKMYYNNGHEGCHGKYPVGVVSITLPQKYIDVNLEPNKDKVNIENESLIIEMLEELYRKFFGPLAKNRIPDSTGESSFDLTCTLASQTQSKSKEKSNSGSDKNKSAFTFFNRQSQEKENRKAAHNQKSSLSDSQNWEVQPKEKGKENAFIKVTVNKDQSNLSDSNDQEIEKINSIFKEIDKENSFALSLPMSKPLYAKIKSSTPKFDEGQKTLQEVWCNSSLVNTTAGGEGSEETPKNSSSLINNDSFIVNHKKHLLSKAHANKDFVVSTQNDQISNSPQKSFGSAISSIRMDEDFESFNEVFGVDINSSVDMTENETVSKLSDMSARTINMSEQNALQDQLHTSVIGEDGIPVYKIPPIQCTDESKISFNVTNNNELPEKNQTILNKSAENALKNHSTTNVHSNLLVVDRDKSISIGNLNEEKVIVRSNQVEEFTDIDDIFATDFNEIAENWSRGDICLDGKNVQPVELVGPNNAKSIDEQQNTAIDKNVSKTSKRPRVSLESTNEKVKKPKINIFDSMKYDVIQGERVRKPSSALALFADDIRDKIMSENPGGDFTVIGQEVANRWRELDAEAKQSYNNKANEDQLRYQNDVERINETKNSTLLACTPFNKKKTLEKMVAPISPHIGQKPDRRSIQNLFTNTKSKQRTVSLNLNKIKTLCQETTESSLEQGLDVIGSIGDSNGWLCHKEGVIMAVNIFRMLEITHYNSLLKNHVIPASLLPKATVFNSSSLGVNLWQTLLKLEKEKLEGRRFFRVVDRRIISNGFKLVLFPNDDGLFTHGEITSQGDCVGFYGVRDLQEVLSHIFENPSVKLELTRPLKIQNWMKGEAVRMARTSSNLRRAEEVDEKLNSWRQITNFDGRLDDSIQSLCLHNKPIFSTVFDLENIPLSLSQGSQE